jgi:hypothetical protein
MFRLIYGHLQVLVQFSLRKLYYLLGLGGRGARYHFTKYGCYDLTFGVLGVLPRLGQTIKPIICKVRSRSPPPPPQT